MNPITETVKKFSAEARKKRAEIFKNYFRIDEDTKILDLGSENGSNIFTILKGSNYRSQNIYIADIDANAVEEGNRLYGFNAVVINEDGKIPFADKFFDIVYSSSVIEHVTVSKSEIWNLKNGKEFKKAAFRRQKEFAEEIIRLGKQYFVQTPCKSFPVESHTWLPAVGYLPRELFVPFLKISNRFWVKRSAPDFNLLGREEMKELFPNAEVILEKKFGLTKSIMAVKSGKDFK